MEMIADEMMRIGLSLGFPAWAAVVWVSAMKVTKLIADLSERLQISHADAEKRLALLEEMTRRLERLAEQHDSRLLTLERGGK